MFHAAAIRFCVARGVNSVAMTSQYAYDMELNRAPARLMAVLSLP